MLLILWCQFINVNLFSDFLWDLGNFALPLQIKVARLNGQIK